MQNILSLWNSKEVLSQAIGLKLYNNHDSIIGSIPDICYFIKLLANESAFCEYLGRDSSQSSLPELFANGIVLLAKGVALTKYIRSLQGNWGTKKSRENIGGKEDNTVESENDIVEGQERDLENDNNVDNYLQQFLKPHPYI